ncbi:vomeronasal type-2 receptor 1 [Xenopus laevis]|uniref:Vomeronasal type-2 receptor 1 n=1 Tax=Xenopus laevis TaxID=8355 RepID=A0A8J1MTU5_XENLA|nr:vomeronasal type-2 receptor 1 [Xenopus laevis]
MQALVFAVEEINRDADLLPNITLGFHIFDTCTVLRRAVEGTLWMLSGGGGGIIPNFNCHKTAPLAGIIGDSGSSQSILMAQILGLSQCSQLLHYVKNINFKTQDGSHVVFDAKGNPQAVYDIVNWQVSLTGVLDQVTVGSFDLTNLYWNALNIDSSKVIWSNGSSQVWQDKTYIVKWSIHLLSYFTMRIFDVLYYYNTLR